MFTALALRRHRSPGLFKIVAAATCAMTALSPLGVTRPATAEDGAQRPRYDRRLLSEMAEGVLRNAAAANQSVGQPSLPGWVRALNPEPDSTVIDTEVDESKAAAHIAPAPEAISVPIASSARAAQAPVPAGGEDADYQSNTWRQRADTGRGLSFSSDRLAPAFGLDPALAIRAHGLRAEDRQYTYGFILFRDPVDEALEKKLAGLDVKLLGPHDDHYKARLPIASLQAIAALPEVEWVGVSSRQQRQSVELSEVRGRRGQTAVVGPTDPIPVVINLFDADDSGDFRRQLEAAGATVGRYDPDLLSYRAVATGPAIDSIVALDFVLFVELIPETHPLLDQSMPLIDADLVRPGPTTYGLPRFGGTGVPIGIMDSGTMMGWGGHPDLSSKIGCGRNFTDDGLSAFDDELGHGTFVLGVMAGTGTADSRYRGMAPLVGSSGASAIRSAKVFRKDVTTPRGERGDPDWTMDAMDWMARTTDECGLPMPLVVNYSGGRSGTYQTGTDDTSRRLDQHVWTNRQLYVVAAGNDGPIGATINAPGVAKNALTVGSVYDFGDQQLGVKPGDLSYRSSRGPTGDGRMKPNVVAPGQDITSAWAGGPLPYKTDFGTSFAAPHVAGLAATLIEHYPFELDPAMLRAHLMATAMAHNNVTGRSNEYGLGRVDAYRAHWDHSNNDGWTNYFFSGIVDSSGYVYRDITVPPGTRRLAIAMTWDELPASSGASRAVIWDLDLWADQLTDCSGNCVGYRSASRVDNVEYIVKDNPPAGTYRLRVFPTRVSLAGVPFGLAATVIRGDTKGEMQAYITAPTNAPVGSTFPVTMSVANHSFVASGVHVDLGTPPAGVTPLYVETTRLDGVNMRFTAAVPDLTLGSLPPEWSRSATWYFRATTGGAKTFTIRARSENGDEIKLSKTVQIDGVTNLVQTAMGTTPSSPVVAPGATFSVTDTVQNSGTSPSASSTTRYYLSLDAVKSADDALLNGTHVVPGLDPGASHTATVTVAIPAGTTPNSYFVIACADDKNTVVEGNEGDNCMATPGAIVTVARPDLVQTAAAMNPPAPMRVPGTTFAVTDTVRNLGPVASGPSTTRYYLSLDSVKGAGDVLLVGSRAIPGLAAGAVNSGTMTVTIPTTAGLNNYFLLACADDLSKVAESDETNNCVASPTAAVTVTRPDLAQTAVSAPPATKQRGTSFPVTDTAQNIGAVASGPAATRYYLSVDATKSAGDTLLTGSRTLPALAAGASHTGSATLTIPATTAPNTYFLVACADGGNMLVETDEANNCRAASSTVTVTP